MTNSNNTMRTIKTIATSTFLAVLFFGCGGTAAVLSTPIENIDTSPQIIIAILDQLVNKAGVAQEDIYIGDPGRNFDDKYGRRKHGI